MKKWLAWKNNSVSPTGTKLQEARILWCTEIYPDARKVPGRQTDFKSKCS